MLAELVISQLLSGVRLDGCKIDFRSKTSNDKVYSISQMSQNFNEAVDRHREILCKGETQEQYDEFCIALNEVLGSIPMLGECIHHEDIAYFEEQICEYAKEYRRLMQMQI